MQIPQVFIGKKYHRLLILKFSHKIKYTPYYLCKCDCGNLKEVNLHSLMHGDTRSCGCLRKNQKNAYKIKAKTRNPTYSCWKAMQERICITTHSNYKNYGGRGIKICDRWSGKNGFENFVSDMGPRPSKNHSIDRINNDGNYEPSNCRWATNKEQSRNKRTNIIITFDNKTQTLMEWSKELGISHRTLLNRWRYGQPIERLFFKGTLSKKHWKRKAGVPRYIKGKRNI